MPMAEPVAFDGTIKPTKETYDQIQQAYDYLNRALFKGELPNCLITLQRRNRTCGYFSGDRFGRSDGLVTDEIALNPRHFHNRPVTEVPATLAHAGHPCPCRRRRKRTGRSQKRQAGQIHLPAL